MKIYPDDWRIRLIIGMTVAVCMAAAMILGPVVGVQGFGPGMLAILVGIMLGGLVARRVFRPSSNRPPDHLPRA